MTVRVEVVTPCEHDKGERHPIAVVLKDHLGPGLDDVGYDWSNMCPGGSRRSFTEWPPEAIEAAEKAVLKALTDLRRSHISLLPRQKWAVVDQDGIQRLTLNDVVRITSAAAWGHITGDQQ